MVHAGDLWFKKPFRCKAEPSVNWNSPDQIKAIFTKLGLDLPNTRDIELESHRSDHPIIPLIQRYRAAERRSRLSTAEWAPHAETGRVHADWRVLGTETGRMSCAKPNLQNIPRSEAYRRCVKAAPGNVFVKADYSQIELRIAAQMAPDETMLQAFKDGVDVHKLTAMRVAGKETEAQVSDHERQLAKGLNFGLIYGMGFKRLAKALTAEHGIPTDEDEAEILRTRYFQTYKGLRNWQKQQFDAIETRTVAGRRRLFGDRSVPTQKLESPVSGTAADGFKLALALLFERPAPSRECRPVLMSHDEIVIECPADVAEAAKGWLVGCMVDGMAEFLTKVPVVVEAEIVETWAG